MPVPFPRWNDDRLDELSHKVGRMDDVVTKVAVLETLMDSLTRAVDANTKATGHVSEQLEQVQIEPLKRGQTFRTSATLVLMGAAAGGGVSLIAAALAAH